jgi:thioredoxin 1
MRARLRERHRRSGRTSEDKGALSALATIALHFYGAESKACETLSPRFAAVAQKFSGKVRFLKVLRDASAPLASKLGVSASPTVLFLSAGKETAERLSGDEIKRTDLKRRVEALLPAARDPAAAERT